MKPLSKWWLLLLLVPLLVLFSACTPTPNCAVNYTVTKEEDTNDGVCSNLDCSLREAVLNANSCPGPHTITLPAGSYSLTIPGIDEDASETGDLDITKDLTIIGIGAPSINGNIDRSFHIHSPAMVTLDGIWLANGTAILGGGLVNESELYLSSFTCNYNSVEIPPGGMGDARGGCIFNAGDLTILGGQFLANTAGYGGAIYNYENSSLIIENSDFTGNEADHLGGAIWNGLNADLDINGASFRLNESDLHGGGIWNHGNLEGVDLYFEENQAAGNGGGVFAWTDSFTTFTNTWLTLNTADLGGGLYNDNGMVHFYESGLTANTATGGAGGGVYNLGPAPPAGLLMKNVTVSNNTATGGLGGAGIYNNSNFDLRFITVADNNPEGIRIDGGAEIKIRSSALSNNVGGNCIGIPPDSLDYNIENDGSCAFSGPHDLPATDPLLEPLAANGGMAPSHALGVGSPAIDTGVPDLCIAYDQNGTTRPQGPWCDRGAHENIYTKGIIRGWTYIDDNDNSIRDPGEGSVTGALLILKEGPCPGVSDIITVESESAGFYEIFEIDPGDYCLVPSPLQQSADPTSMDLTIMEGSILEDINFRYMLRVPDTSASGLVWHDLCAVPHDTPATPPPGCVDLGGGSLGANGIYDPGVDRITKRHINKKLMSPEELGNGVYVLSQQEIEILNLTLVEQGHAKPYFKNSDIEQYYCNHTPTKYVLYLTRDMEIGNFPNLYKHVDFYRKVIDNRSRDRGEMQAALKMDKWWVIFAARNEKIFLSEKIVCPQRSDKNTFGYNDVSWYGGTDIYFITKRNPDVNLKFILAILNSSLYYLWFYYRGKRKGNNLELLYQPLSEVPIPNMDQKMIEQITAKIDEILSLKGLTASEERKTRKVNLVREIDQLIYGYFNLSDEEISIIEESRGR